MSKLWFYHWCWRWWWWWWCWWWWWWWCWWWWWWWWWRLALLYPQKKHRAEKKAKQNISIITEINIYQTLDLWRILCLSSNSCMFGMLFGGKWSWSCWCRETVWWTVAILGKPYVNHIDMRFLTSFFLASSWDEDDFHGVSVVPRFGRRFRWLIIQPFQFFHVESTPWIHPGNRFGGAPHDSWFVSHESDPGATDFVVSGCQILGTLWKRMAFLPCSSRDQRGRSFLRPFANGWPDDKWEVRGQQWKIHPVV